MTITTGTRCVAETNGGRSCKSAPLPNSPFCFWHDPDKVEERRAAQVKGGKRRHGRVIGSIPPADTPMPDMKPLPIEQIDRLDADSINQVLIFAINSTMRLEPGIERARVLGSLATAALKAIEAGEIEERLKAFEEKLMLTVEQRFKQGSGGLRNGKMLLPVLEGKASP